MRKGTVQPSPPEQDAQEPAAPQSAKKKTWQEPKVKFVEPKLTKHGSLEEVTGQGFFGGFTPTSRP